MREASAHGAFAICSTTPQLADSMRARVAALDMSDVLSCVLMTSGDPQQLMADEVALDAALGELIDTAVRDYGARGIVIGGGPLAAAAQRLAPASPVPLIEPIPAAVRFLYAAINRRAQYVERRTPGPE